MRNIVRSLDSSPRLVWEILLAAVLTAIVLAVLPSVAGAAEYTVREGDTLGEIADRYSTTAGAIARANGIRNWDLIQVGQRLAVPGSTTGAPTATPVTAPKASTEVKPGDTLIRIAKRLGTTPDALARANGIRNPDLIYVGQTLYAPSASVPESPASAGAYSVPVAGYRDYVPTHWNEHPGAADLMASRGTPIYAVAGGKVVEVSTVGMGGNNVTIRGTDGRYYYFAHMNEYPWVRQGQTVKSGQRIGSVGDTGNATGRPHLHLAIGDRITTGRGDGRGGYGTNFDVPKFLNRLISSASRR